MAKYIDDNGLLYFWQQLKTMLAGKVDVVSGKGLSESDFTSTEKTKLSGIAAGAEVNVQSDWNATEGDALILNKPTIPSAPSVPVISTSINDDATSDTKTASPKAVKTYVDSTVSSLYRPAGSVTFANLPALTSAVLGNVYNVTTSFTTTASFVEGAGIKYPSGMNVVVVASGESYLFDVLSGMVDLSDYWSTTDLVAMTNAEITEVLEE